MTYGTALYCRQTLAAEQEVAHVVAEGAADVAAAVGHGTREAATVERSKCVGAATAKRQEVRKLKRLNLNKIKPPRDTGADVTCTGVFAWDHPRCSRNICKMIKKQRQKLTDTRINTSDQQCAFLFLNMAPVQ